jgi:hypothetical protein
MNIIIFKIILVLTSVLAFFPFIPSVITGICVFNILLSVYIYDKKGDDTYFLIGIMWCILAVSTFINEVL